MTIVEFPDIEANIRFYSTQPTYVNNLTLPIIEPHDSLAHSVAIPVESTGTFVGGTIDLYENCLRYLKQGEIDLSSEEFQDLFLRDFIHNPWFTPLVLDEKGNLSKTLSGIREVEEALKENKERVIFVPNEEYTRVTWNFRYDPNYLEREAPYRLSEEEMAGFLERMTPYKLSIEETIRMRDAAEGLGALITSMKFATPSMTYMNDLFHRMSHPILRPYFEELVQTRYQELANSSQVTLKKYMDRYGFNN